MTIITRYIIKEFFKYFAMVQVVVLTLFVFIDYLTKIGKFIKAELALSYAFGFVLLKVPFVSTLLMPVCCILASVIVFMLMARNNELTAMKSGGTSVYRLLRPMIISGILATIVFFIVSELVVPKTQTTANGIKRIIRNRDVKTTRDNNIWLRKENAIIHIQYYNAENKVLSGVSVFYFDDKFKLTRRIDAEKGVYDAASWMFHGVHEMKKMPETGAFFSRFYPDMLLEIEIKPEDLKSVIKRSQEMSFRELWRYVNKVRSQGYEPTTYVVDMQAKLSFPFSCFILCIIGAGIALAGKNRGLPTGIGIGICAAFLYWFFHSFCVSMGYGEVLPPVIAAWLGNIVFICIAGVLLLNAE